MLTFYIRKTALISSVVPIAFLLNLVVVLKHWEHGGSSAALHNEVAAGTTPSLAYFMYYYFPLVS